MESPRCVQMTEGASTRGPGKDPPPNSMTASSIGTSCSVVVVCPLSTTSRCSVTIPDDDVALVTVASQSLPTANPGPQ